MAKTNKDFVSGYRDDSMEELKEWLKPRTARARDACDDSMEELKEWLKHNESYRENINNDSMEELKEWLKPT